MHTHVMTTIWLHSNRQRECMCLTYVLFSISAYQLNAANILLQVVQDLDAAIAIARVAECACLSAICVSVCLHYKRASFQWSLSVLLSWKGASLVCMCVYVCICMYVCMYMYMYTYLHTEIHIYTYIYICMYNQPVCRRVEIFSSSNSQAQVESCCVISPTLWPSMVLLACCSWLCRCCSVTLSMLQCDFVDVAVWLCRCCSVTLSICCSIWSSSVETLRNGSAA
jgi:hypothetical protein